MALKKEAIAAFAKLAKIKVEDLEKAITEKDEVDIEIDDKLSTFTETEVDTLKKNEYNSGKTKGVEMAVKETKEKLDLDFQGKTLDGLVTAVQKKAVDDAKINPDKKVTELTEKLTTVQATAADLQKKLEEKEGEVSTVKINAELMKNVPAGTSLDPDDVIILMRNKGYEFKMEEGKLVVHKDGKVMTDNLSNALPVKQVVESFVTEKKLVSAGSGDDPTPGGRGGDGGKKAVKFGKLSEIKAHFAEQKKSMLGSEFSEAVQKATADNKEFDMNS